VAKGNGFGGFDLYNNRETAERRTFFSDEPDAKSCGFDTVKYSGRSGTAFKKRISSVSRDSEGFKGRIRNTTVAMPENRLSYRHRHFGNDKVPARNRKNVEQSHSETEGRRK
jgi:hypothetical protein